MKRLLSANWRVAFCASVLFFGCASDDSTGDAESSRAGTAGDGGSGGVAGGGGIGGGAGAGGAVGGAAGGGGIGGDAGAGGVAGGEAGTAGAGGSSPRYMSAWTPGVCATVTILDVSVAPGPNVDGLLPRLTARCEGEEMVVESNDIPHFTFTPLTPNALTESEYVWRIPISPELSSGLTELPLLGTIGFTVTGLSINGANEGPMPDPYGDPVLNGIMDACQGHTGMDYHVHSMNQQCFVPSGLVAQPWLNDPVDQSIPSPILGWALDGFPIYGSYGCVDESCEQVIEFISSWDNTSIQAGTEGCTTSESCDTGKVCGLVMQSGEVTTACADKDYAWDTNVFSAKEGDAYLDQCNGRIQPDGTYGYHITSTFPYTLGCYRGMPQTQAGQDNPGDGLPDGPDGMSTPQAAAAACANLNAGDPCNFNGPNNMQITGVCGLTPDNVLACMPEGLMPPR